MKKIEAVIKPFQFGTVRSALNEAGIEDLTVTPVKDFGALRSASTRESEYSLDFSPKVKLEVVVPDKGIDAAIRVIADSTAGDKIPEGELIVYSIEHAIRIRTNQTGESALTESGRRSDQPSTAAASDRD